MAFVTLTQDEQDDQIVSYFLSQERDLNSHQINKTRYETILAGTISGTFRARIEKLLFDTNDRIAEVQSIIDATRPQLPTQLRIDASMLRITAIENAARGI